MAQIEGTSRPAPRTRTSTGGTTSGASQTGSTGSTGSSGSSGTTSSSTGGSTGSTGSPRERLADDVRSLNDPPGRHFTDPETLADPPAIQATGVLNDTVKLETPAAQVQEPNPLHQELAAKLDQDPEFQKLMQTDSEKALEFLFGDGNANVDLSQLGPDAKQRMEFVLDYTANEPGRPVHFAKPFNDTGFNENFRDGAIWAHSGNQVGHFLTAVDIGMEHTGAYPKLLEVSAAIGHEKYGDGGPLGDVTQGLAGLNTRDHALFNLAVEAVKNPELTAQQKYDAVQGSTNAIVPELPQGQWKPEGFFDSLRVGNSQQDLRLTTYGVALGEMIKDGQITTTDQVQAFLQQNLSAGNGVPVTTGP